LAKIPQQTAEVGLALPTKNAEEQNWSAKEGAQRGRAATKNQFLAEPAENAEENLFFNNFIYIFLCVLGELWESNPFS